MRISFTGEAMRYMSKSAGYGQAAEMMLRSFIKLGVDCGFEIENPDIEISWSDPWNHQFKNWNAYKIAYSAWESTDLIDKQLENFKHVDEIWGTSPWVANVFKHHFPNKPVFYYKHGIDERFVPKKRTSAHKPFTFLHVGEPFSRKDGQMTAEAFTELFGNDPDYRLIMKASRINTVRLKNQWGYWSTPPSIYNNVVSVESVLTNEEMLDLYKNSDVFVYPSWGEGFGFQPLEALAMGMPVISTYDWSDYKKYIPFKIESELSTNPWQNIHPGFMYKPNKESLKEQMLNCVNNYEEVAQTTFKKAFDIHKDYDWLSVTEPAVQRLKEIYKNL